MVNIKFQKTQKIVRSALKEDLGKGDITSNLIVPETQKGEGIILAKEKGIIAGLGVAKSVFKQIDPKLVFKPLVKDGTEVMPNQRIASVKGRVKTILMAERTTLNFLQRLSGIATLTNQYVRKLKGTKVKILDTRKTTPGLRILEKYAVRKGGGENHRQGLYDMILIKDNHIQSAGSISSAIKKVLKNRKNLKIEVETKNLKEVKEALNFKIDCIMLDNFKLKDLRKAVKLIRKKDKKIEIEASGQVTLKNVRSIALSGVDYISVGALTHSAKALDLSLILK
jgi:nicotinate-nucleotide pyrophosphorylase (carboxylating)